MNRYELSGISWDTDGERVKLPKKVLVDVGVNEDISSRGADILSDRFGWCVNGFSIKRVDIDIDEEISRACEFMWVKRDEMSLRDFARVVCEHLGEKYIRVSSKAVLEYLVELE